MRCSICGKEYEPWNMLVYGQRYLSMNCKNCVDEHTTPEFWGLMYVLYGDRNKPDGIHDAVDSLPGMAEVIT